MKPRLPSILFHQINSVFSDNNLSLALSRCRVHRLTPFLLRRFSATLFTGLGDTGALDAVPSIPLVADGQESSLRTESRRAPCKAKRPIHPQDIAIKSTDTIQPASLISTGRGIDGNMGGERDMARLTKPKLEYPVLAQKPVKKMFPKIYLERIETSYKGGQYSEHNLQAYVLNPVQASTVSHLSRPVL